MSFLYLLRAEWTKFRTVPGWVLGIVAGAAAVMALGLFPGYQGSCGQHGPESECVPTVGPDGEEVTDSTQATAAFDGLGRAGAWPGENGPASCLIAGTGALLAAAAILALAIGTVIRHSAAAVATVVVVIVLPYLLSVTVLPIGAARALLRVAPAAAFAVQQSAIRYPQIDNVYSPVGGYYPLAPWAGLAVLGAWTAVALLLAAVLLRRRHG
jgi:hypothetical protein